MKTLSYIALATFVAAAFAPFAQAKEKQPPEAASPAEVKPGNTALLKSAEKGMRYFLRVPKKYDARTGSQLIVFRHGSNMNGLDYLRSFEAKKWCEDAILCCPNGENGTDPFGKTTSASRAARSSQTSRAKCKRRSRRPSPTSAATHRARSSRTTSF